MSFTTELMDAARKAQGIQSDYRLAQVLGVGRTAVSSWRVGRTFPMFSTTYKLAQMAGMDLGAAHLGVGLDRMNNPEGRAKLRAAWRGDLADPDPLRLGAG